MKRLLVGLILFALLVIPLAADEPNSAWLLAFEAEHGYMPDADPGLLALGFTPDEAMAEHLAALEWSRDLGHAPDAAEWEARWCQAHKCGQLMSTHSPPGPSPNENCLRYRCDGTCIPGRGCIWYECICVLYPWEAK